MQPGHTITISDSNPHDVAGCFAFVVEADAIFSSVTGSLTGYTGITYKASAGTRFANLTSVTLVSGTVTFYLR